MRIFPIALVAASCGVLALAAPAHAGRGDHVPATQRVNFADLDLTRADDIATLNRRVGKAVIAVCGPRIIGDKVGQARVATCREQTRAAVEPRLAILTKSGSTRMTAIDVAPPKP